MAEKKKGLGDALIGLFVVREGENEAEADPQGTPKPVTTGDAAADELIAKYAASSPSVATSATAKSVPNPPPVVPATGPGASGSLPSVNTSRSTRPPRPPVPGAAENVAPGSGPSPVASEPVPEVKIDATVVLKKAGLSDDEMSRVERILTLLLSLPAETPLEVKRQIVGASLQAFGISIEQIIESTLLHMRAFERHGGEGQRHTQAFLEQGTRRIDELEKELSRIRSSMKEQQAQQKGLELACNSKRRRFQDILEFFGSESVEKATKISAKLRQGQTP